MARDDASDYCNLTSYTIAGGSYPSDCPLSPLADLGDCVPATACFSTEPCAQGLCVGASCGDIWTCIEDRRTCSTNLADYCGCDGVTFQDSQACPTRPYASRGACGQGTNCDQRDVACDLLPPTCDLGQFPRVVGSCWDGTCVPIEQCACTVSEECPEDLVCWSQLHCGPLER